MILDQAHNDPSPVTTLGELVISGAAVLADDPGFMATLERALPGAADQLRLAAEDLAHSNPVGIVANFRTMARMFAAGDDTITRAAEQRALAARDLARGGAMHTLNNAQAMCRGGLAAVGASS